MIRLIQQISENESSEKEGNSQNENNDFISKKNKNRNKNSYKNEKGNEYVNQNENLVLRVQDINHIKLSLYKSLLIGIIIYQNKIWGLI